MVIAFKITKKVETKINGKADKGACPLVSYLDKLFSQKQLQISNSYGKFKRKPIVKLASQSNTNCSVPVASAIALYIFWPAFDFAASIL